MKSKSKNKFSSKLADSATIQRLVSVTDDMLKTLISMSSALLAVGVIFDSFVKVPLMRIFIILMFFLGLIISFLGVLPLNVRYDIEDAEELKDQQVDIFLRKRRHLWFSAGAMLLGFILVIVDLIMDVFSKSPV
ncbi:MAG: hypothetical protein LIO93_10010 [Bacteroidales bacterium]|nr:hypothetical protein [Bacteroidales bacterium]